MTNSSINNKANKLKSDISFTLLMSQYQTKIFYLAAKYFRGQQDREDVVQETFLRVYLHVERIDDEKKIANWIYTIGRHVCLDMLRKKKNRQIESISFFDGSEALDTIAVLTSSESTPEEKLIRKELIIELKNEFRSAFQQLPSKWKPCMYQRYFQEMTVKEISVLNGIPENTAKIYLFRGRKHIKQRITFYKQNLKRSH
ncbi:RNA polymerase sigma factor [Paenibacillus polymyxa]|uniref:RNA polymerase sigma factor n=1 Tax=Paenibacillus polymyxa TaxID=1406 RepID=UPI0023F743B5|nr:sigma-70 family RNA polymerase sigma factor [Paenibacillus polymyxa]